MGQVENFTLRNIVSCFKLLKHINLSSRLEWWVLERWLSGWDACSAHESWVPLSSMGVGGSDNVSLRRRDRWYQQLTARQPGSQASGMNCRSMRDLASENQKATEENSQPWSLPPYMPAQGSRYRHRKFSAVVVYKVFIKRNSMSLLGSSPRYI